MISERIEADAPGDLSADRGSVRTRGLTLKISAPPIGLMIENSDGKASRKAISAVAAIAPKCPPSMVRPRRALSAP